MFFANLLPLEIPKMENFIKAKIKEISQIFSKDPEHIPKTELPYIVRYFLQFPSQQQVVYEIIPEIEKLDTDSDKQKEFLQITAVEKYILILLKANTYPDNDKEILIEAFRVLDSDKLGYIDLHTYYSFLKSFGISFTSDQIQEMEKFLVENETDFLSPMKLNPDTMNKFKHNQYSTRKFYYETYVRKVISDNKKHFDNLKNEFTIFKQLI
jgi:Ca2+-binding EF-hand superfamily protein